MREREMRERERERERERDADLFKCVSEKKAKMTYLENVQA